MSRIVETQGLTKRYGRFTAVRGLDLQVEEGEVFGLLGPNGSGKTTTILMLLGLTSPTSGRMRVAGFDPNRRPLEVKRRAGYLPDTVGFYGDLSARENLRFSARLARLPADQARERIDAALARMELADVAHAPVSTYSRGMRQRLGLAEVLVKRPALAILDEPTTGLDPDAAQRFLGLIRELREEGMTILLSSHLLHQVQAICDRVGLFERGRMALVGSVPELARRVLGGGTHLVVEARGPGVREALSGLSGVTSVETEPSGAYRVDAERDVRAEVAPAIAAAGGELLALSVVEPKLDDIYARYFEEVRDAA